MGACTYVHSGTNRDERGPPLLCPDVSATRLDGGLDTTLQVTSKLQLRLGLPPPGQTKVCSIFVIIIHLEQDLAGDLNRSSFPKIMKTLHFNVKAVKKVPTKLKSMPAPKLLKIRNQLRNFLKVGTGAGAEKNSFSSAILLKTIGKTLWPNTGTCLLGGWPEL